ncbi:MAG: hypothetical protein R3F20_04470 [Planctomycetota bacterium]
MLEEIGVHNLLVLDEARVSLHPGLNVVSGETGVGKSLFLTAIGALFGGKIGAAGCEDRPTRIEGLFRLEPADRALVPDDLIEPGEDELVIRVGKRAGGSQRTTLNGAMISRRELGALGARLVDVHGQRDLQRLLDEGEQVAILDLFAGTTAEAEAFARLHAEVQKLAGRLRDRGEMERRIAGELEVARYQLQELETVDARPGERAELDRRHRMLLGAEASARALDRVVSLLDDEEEGAASRLGRAGAELGRLGDDDEVRVLGERLDAVVAEIDDLAREAARLGAARAALEDDPEEVGARLDLLNALLRKHGVDEEGLLRRRDELDETVARLERESKSLAGLEAELETRRTERRALGLAIASRREEAGAALATAVEGELAELALAKVRFRVVSGLEEARDESEDEPTARGFGRPRFEVRTNPGRPWGDLAAAASGGEMSRILLALKSVLAERHRMPLMIFDEIESGVGPRLGLVLGRRLKALAAHRQVLCITHFPQIAAFADRHLRIEKVVEDGVGRARIEEIEGKGRLEELASMLGGGDPKLARRQARALLEEARSLGEDATRDEIGVEEAR